MLSTTMIFPTLIFVFIRSDFDFAYPIFGESASIGARGHQITAGCKLSFRKVKRYEGQS